MLGREPAASASDVAAPTKSRAVDQATSRSPRGILRAPRDRSSSMSSVSPGRPGAGAGRASVSLAAADTPIP